MAVQDLLRRIERYLYRSATSATRFGRDAANDPQLVHDLRRGRTPTPRFEARINGFLDRQEEKLGEGRRGQR